MRPDLNFVVESTRRNLPKALTDIEVQHASRPIDILVPLNLAYACASNNIEASVLSRMKSRSVNYKRLAVEVLNSYKGGSESLFELFRLKYKIFFGKEFKVSLPWSEEDVFVLSMLSDIDDVIRGKERLKAARLVFELAEANGMRVVVLQDKNVRNSLIKLRVLSSDSAVEFIGPKDAADMGGFYSASRFVLNVNPTYHDKVHERVLNAAVHGCALISNKNEALEELMEHGEHIYYYDNKLGVKDLDFGADVSQKMSRAALARLKAIYNEPVGDKAAQLLSGYLASLR